MVTVHIWSLHRELVRTWSGPWNWHSVYRSSSLLSHLYLTIFFSSLTREDGKMGCMHWVVFLSSVIPLNVKKKKKKRMYQVCSKGFSPLFITTRGLIRKNKSMGFTRWFFVKDFSVIILFNLKFTFPGSLSESPCTLPSVNFSSVSQPSTTLSLTRTLKDCLFLLWNFSSYSRWPHRWGG